MTLVFMFPGQSSRYPGMLDKLSNLHPCADDILAQAEAVLGFDLRRHYNADNPAAFARNVDVQLGVFIANHMMLATLQAEGLDASLSLGLSLGEYNHLVHIGALEFADALQLVRARGEAYDAGPAGCMASVQPLARDELEAALATIRAKNLGTCEIVNLNSPRQHVISGDHDAIDAAVTLLEDEYYVVPTIIERQVPMHSSRFASVSTTLRPHLEMARFQSPRLPYLPNRLGATIHAATPPDFVELLAAHVHTPVLWQDSLEHIVRSHPDAVLVEVGPRQVLFNLLDRRWLRQPKFHTDHREQPGEHLASVIHTLRGLRSPLLPGHTAAPVQEVQEWPTA